MWYGEARVTSCELRVTSYEFKAQKHELKFKSASSNPGVASSNPLVIKSMKTQGNSLKSSSFPKIMSPKLLGNSWGNSYVQLFDGNLLFYISTTL